MAKKGKYAWKNEQPEFDVHGMRSSRNYRFDMKPRRYKMHNNDPTPMPEEFVGCRYMDIITNGDEINFNAIQNFIRDCGDKPNRIAKMQEFHNGYQVVGLMKGPELEYMGLGRPFLLRDSTGTYHSFTRKSFDAINTVFGFNSLKWEQWKEKK